MDSQAQHQVTIESLLKATAYGPHLEWLRFSGEKVFITRLANLYLASIPFDKIKIPDVTDLRQELMRDSLRLSERSAPDVHLAMKQALANMRCSIPYEIYQTSGESNAASCLTPEMALIALVGQTLTLLDDKTKISIIGHELGHSLLHASADMLRFRSFLRDKLDNLEQMPKDQAAAFALNYFGLLMSQEITADRAGLLACRDLNQMLKLSMIMTTGLPAQSLNWDIEAYMEQCQEYLKQSKTSGVQDMSSHPANAIRACALKLYWESDFFHKQTGLGPGKRRIDEVEQEIFSFFPPLDIDTALKRIADQAVEQKPADIPDEVLRCALASCVILANADSTLTEPEMDAIEDTFAGRVLDYQEYLELEKAIKLFEETAPLVSAIGSEATQVVFSMGMHVTSADGVFDRREIAALLDIGKHLGCMSTWYNTLINQGIISAAAKDDIAAENNIVLPARGEVVSALNAYLDIIDKRGSAKTTLRRLMRLTGIGLVSLGQTIVMLKDALIRRNFKVEPALSEELPPDTTLTITSPNYKKEETVAPIAAGSSLGLLIKGLSKLQSSLISGDGRTPSIRTRGNFPGRIFDLNALEQISAGRSERVVALIASGKSAGLVTPDEASSDKKGSTISSELSLLARTSKSRQDEKGNSDLYVGTRFVVGCINRYPICAPLMLRPVELKRIDGAVPGWEAAPTQDNLIPNYSVLNLIANRSGMNLTDEMIEEIDASCPEGEDALAETLLKMGFFSMDKPDIKDDIDAEKLASESILSKSKKEAAAPTPQEEAANADNNAAPQAAADNNSGTPQEDPLALKDSDKASGAFSDEMGSIARAFHYAECYDKAYFVPCAAIGLFPQSGSDLLKDYEDIIKDLSAPNAVPRDLISGAVHILPQKMQEDFGVSFTETAPPADNYRIPSISLDPSQQAAVDTSNRLPALVVDGPPGTGKSQVIVGLIIDALSKGQRVAIISDKRAALDVVAQRLTSSGLPDCYGLVHDVDSDRPEIYGRIARKLADRRPPAFNTESYNRLKDEHRSIYQALEEHASHLQDKSGIETLARLATYMCALEERIKRAQLPDTIQVPAYLDSIPSDHLDKDAEEITTLHPFADLIQKGSFWSADTEEAPDLQQFDAFLKACADAAPGGKDDARNVESLGGIWLKAFESAQKVKGGLPVTSMFAPWSELNASLPKLIAYQGNFLRWLMPGWYKEKNNVKQWLAKNYPEKAASDLSPKESQELLLIARDAVKVQKTLELVKNVPKGGTDLVRSKLAQDTYRLRQVQDITAHINQINPVLNEMGRLLANSGGTKDAWKLSFLYAWCKVHIEILRPSLAQMAAPTRWGTIEQTIERLMKVEDELSAMERERVAGSLMSFGIMTEPEAQPRQKRTENQKIIEEIAKEAGKKSRRMPLRTFVRKFASSGLLDIVPVWLLSPETMTLLFPRKPVFDIVIFDEASQSTLAGSLPVLMRTKRWVIAGDDKQMPPTSFFTSTGGDEDVLESEESAGARELFDSESLLTLARERAPHIRLSWHYRCQDESLIAFSNHAFYEASLATIPVPPAPDKALAGKALSWIHVDNAEYDAGRNAKEAAAVARILGDHLRDYPNQSVGIITFNIKQRMQILDAIDAMRYSDEQFRANYDAAVNLPIDKRPFVKSLENVQGDERDHIIFSLGHAPVKRKGLQGDEWKVPARFGPLGQKGGERRLNVAVSRAKLRCTIVASFKPEQLSIGNSKNVGPRLFKLYLEYVWATVNGENANAQQQLNKARCESEYNSPATDIANTEKQLELPEDTPLPVQIAMEAEKKGFTVEQNVGAGSFKIPVALFKEGQKPVAVLVDDGTGSETIYDKNVHRPNLLKRKGWQVLLVNPANWLER
ncbi:MAG: DUF4011 domain-containing protein, partial [bacterium]|nr:DUF4011 domain-containing protein [bacterium]